MSCHKQGKICFPILEMRNEGADEDDTILAIEGTIIKKVTET